MAPITPVTNFAGAYAANTGGTNPVTEQRQKFQIAFGQGSNTGKTTTEGPSFTQLVAAAASQGGDSFAGKTTKKQDQPAFGSLPKATGGNPFQQALEKEASNPFALA